MFKQVFSGLFSGSKNLAISELPALLKRKNSLLLDVRERQEFLNGHIPQAINQPLSQLDDFHGDKDKDYLVICQSGMRSQRASRFLRDKGYRVTNVSGGMNAWTGPIKEGK
ncbi:rhodanese-like domain-containing protein [Streptococcus oricebi]|uniref:Sulfurtransferase n=1 Tax=Streptococcus oricebi TaxID=1547447 RepID=A0ABS5B1Q9_9STRE|nr:rhodanese-like domain-containing protein [Streptococcus oricebi]MBP2622771.1 sulfurtransferase [Streptococcus oricebi]